VEVAAESLELGGDGDEVSVMELSREVPSPASLAADGGVCVRELLQFCL